MNKKRTLIISAALLILLIITSAASLAAENKKNGGSLELRIGFVDLSILLSFHPLMQYYSVDQDIFIKPLKKNGTKQELLNEAAERQKRHRVYSETSGEELKKLRLELDSVEAEINRLRVGVSREQDVINRNYTEEYTGLQSEADRKARTQKYQRALSDIDVRYYGAKKKYDDRKEQINARIIEISRGIGDVDYLNKKESLDLLNGIAAEISAALKEVADENRIGVVLNSSSVSIFTPPAELKHENHMLEDPYLPGASIPEVNYGALFETPSGREHLNESDTIVEDCGAVFMKRSSFVESLMKKGVSMHSNRMFAHGGEDLTVRVLENILRKYSVPQAKMDIITKRLIKMMNADHERTNRTEEAEEPTAK